MVGAAMIAAQLTVVLAGQGHKEALFSPPFWQTHYIHTLRGKKAHYITKHVRTSLSPLLPFPASLVSPYFTRRRRMRLRELARRRLQNVF